MSENKLDLTFESAMKKLEETVRKLESGDLGLSDSIEEYKTSMQLVQFCRQQLSQAELEIEQLVQADASSATGRLEHKEEVE